MEEVKDKKLRSLAELKKGQGGRVAKVTAKGDMKKRFLEMGIVHGTQMSVTGCAPLGDPLEISVKGYKLSLRRQEALNIFIED
jgi:Fe2+ transport system protein FeoA